MTLTSDEVNRLVEAPWELGSGPVLLDGRVAQGAERGTLYQLPRCPWSLAIAGDGSAHLLED